MTEWLDNPVVGSAIYEIAKDREVKWLVSDGDLEFGIRHARINWSKDTLRWLEILEASTRPVSIFIGTNVINWKIVDVLPPRLREGKGLNKEGRENYNKIWNEYTIPEGCEQRGIDFHELWLGKNLVWDIDHETDLMIAFSNAHKIHTYLKEIGYSPTLVFSGNKGFHVWLNYIESAELVGKTLQDVEQDDPLRRLGKLYRNKIQEISLTAVGCKLPTLDLAPAQRQGIIRCPYSQHGKTGLVVWPLSDEDINLLDSQKHLQKLSAKDVAKILHTWDMTNWSGKKVPMPPHYTIINRGLFELSSK